MCLFWQKKKHTQSIVKVLMRLDLQQEFFPAASLVDSQGSRVALLSAPGPDVLPNNCDSAVVL